MVNKILFFTLSNFGDVILTLPVLDVLRAEYPDAQITVMVGPRAAQIFKNNPYIQNLIIYNKYAPFKQKADLFFNLKKENFDMVIDLRNTFYGALLPARFRTSPFLRMPFNIKHVKQQSLYRLKKAIKYKKSVDNSNRKSIYFNQEEEDYINDLLRRKGIADNERIIIVSPVAGGRTRRWQKDKFIELCQSLALNYPVILIARKEDKPITEYIKNNCSGRVFDFAGLTDLAQLSCLLKKSSVVVVCDTGILHLASYLNIPVVALFGPSDEFRYGPWSSKFKIVTSSVPCRPCRRPSCRANSIQCMHDISVRQVLDSIDALLKS